MAGGLIITAVFDSGGVSFADDLDRLLADMGMELVVVHGPGACDPCRANDDPHDVPCQACTGNVAGRHPNSPRAAAVGNLCQCTVETRPITDGEAHDA